jgi:hypothetical protein
MFENFRFPHSAEVRMWLDCGPHGRVDLSRVTPTSVVAREPRDVPPGDADLVVVVDGEEMRTRVHIANGLSRTSRVALVLPVDQVAPF